MLNKPEKKSKKHEDFYRSIPNPFTPCAMIATCNLGPVDCGSLLLKIKPYSKT
jgi:hypothetical protein